MGSANPSVRAGLTEHCGQRPAFCLGPQASARPIALPFPGLWPSPSCWKMRASQANGISGVKVEGQ
jgi:hypothetical protein